MSPLYHNDVQEKKLIIMIKMGIIFAAKGDNLLL